MIALSHSPETTAFQCWIMSIYSNIKFEHRICLNNNLKKCHLSFSLNRANQINMSKLDKRLPKNATIPINYFSSKLDKTVPKNATYKVW
jgi:hypothetical protein